MDGTLHDLSEDFESHIQCRCTPTPVTKSWKDILSPLGLDTSSLDQFDNEDNYQSGSDWFDQQDASTQQQILGSKAAYNLYRSGKVDLQDFVGVSFSKDWGGARYQKSVKELTGV
jgi:hypothetical protein